jgi:hypothetical protein
MAHNSKRPDRLLRVRRDIAIAYFLQDASQRAGSLASGGSTRRATIQATSSQQAYLRSKM